MIRPRLGLGWAALCAAMACGGDNPVQPLPVCSIASAQVVTLAVGQYQSMDPATNNGCFGFPANASATDSARYLIAPWSAAAKPADSAAFILATPSRLSAAATLAADLRPAPRRSIVQEFDAFRRRAARTGRYGAAVNRMAAAAAAAQAPPIAVCKVTTPGQLCSFIVCNVVTCATNDTVGARLQILGSHVAIFVDTLAPTNGLVPEDYDTLRTILDTRLYPLDVAHFGAVSDVDSNGVVIILMTPVVNHLVSVQECNTVGFILGFFFGADLDPRFRFLFNRGEIYYSLVADPGGMYSCPHDRESIKRLAPRTFAHELQHMINFAQHAVLRSTPVPVSEEGWLDEGLSTYAEELAATTYIDPSYPNVPQPDTVRYRRYLVFGDLIDAHYYFQDPPSNYLEIPEDNGKVGEIGASWLFVRYLIDQYGPALAGKLTQTTLYGSANVAAQTGVDFATLVNRWALANYVSDLPGFSAPPELKYTSWQFRTAFDTVQSSVRRAINDSIDFTPPFPLIPNVYPGSSIYTGGTLRSGTGAYLFAVQGPNDPAFALLFSTPTRTALPAHVVPRLNIVRIH